MTAGLSLQSAVFFKLSVNVRLRIEKKKHETKTKAATAYLDRIVLYSTLVLPKINNA